MKHSMNDKNFLTQPLLHWVSLKGIKMNSEVTSMNFFGSHETYLKEKLKVKVNYFSKQGQATGQLSWRI